MRSSFSLIWGTQWRAIRLVWAACDARAALNDWLLKIQSDPIDWKRFLDEKRRKERKKEIPFEMCRSELVKSLICMCNLIQLDLLETMSDKIRVFWKQSGQWAIL